MPEASETTETLKDVHARLRQGFAEGTSLPLKFRIAQLKKIRQFLYETENDLLAALDADLNKKKVEAMTLDVIALHTELDYFFNKLEKLIKPTFASRDAGPPVYITKKPKGVVLIFSAFNYSILLSIRPMINAIAAGNAVCLKPSELATASEDYLTRLRSVLDPRLFGVVTGGPDVCNSLLELKWDHILFTGSSSIGRIVMAAAAKHLTPVTLELGGKNPAFITSSADMVTAAEAVARSRYSNCGQFCLATEYCLVEESVYDEFVDAMVKTVRDFYTDDPKTCRNYSRIISSKHVERLAGMLAKSTGRVLVGGDHDDAAQHYFAPTVVEVETGDDTLMQAEIFGPILPILKVKTTEDAISFVNAREKPLAMYVFCQDRKVTEDMLKRTCSGSVGVNQTMFQIVGKNSFIGGVGESGMGRYGMKAGFETFSDMRPVMYSTPRWGWIFRFLNPTHYSSKEGEDNESMVVVVRLMGKVPFPGSGGVPVHERIGRVCSFVTKVAAASVAVLVIGAKVARKKT